MLLRLIYCIYTVTMVPGSCSVDQECQLLTRNRSLKVYTPDECHTTMHDAYTNFSTCNTNVEKFKIRREFIVCVIQAIQVFCSTSTNNWISWCAFHVYTVCTFLHPLSELAKVLQLIVWPNSPSCETITQQLDHYRHFQGQHDVKQSMY